MNKFMTLAALAGALAGLPLAANATVTWSFYETSCSPISGGGSCRPYTSALASLTLPTPTSSGSASWTGSPLTPPVVGGDTDFTFTPEHGDSIAPPDYGFNSLCNMGTGSVDTVCSYDIGWSESAGILDGIGHQLPDRIKRVFQFRPYRWDRRCRRHHRRLPSRRDLHGDRIMAKRSTSDGAGADVGVVVGDEFSRTWRRPTTLRAIAPKLFGVRWRRPTAQLSNLATGRTTGRLRSS